MAVAAAVVLVAGCAPEDGVGGASALLRYQGHGHGHGHGHDGQDSLVGEVREMAAAYGVTPIPPAPPVSDEMFSLGQALMFDKELSGNRDASCMTCHFSSLGTDDDRALALGVGGRGVGAERAGGLLHPRNVLALFNLHARKTQFWDNRIEMHGRHIEVHEAGNEITPQMQRVFEFGPTSPLGMLPVVTRGEMRGQRFHNGESDNELEGDLERPEVWARLMARLGAIPEYRAMFEAAYPGTSFDDMTFAHAANAMAGFEVRAFEARNSPWQQFLEGDDDALTGDQLAGAHTFFEAGCANCHNGPLLSDEQVHNTGLAQFGPGKGDGQFDTDDFGRANVRYFRLSEAENLGIHGPQGDPHTHNHHDRYAFRTASLINVALTAPFGHVGQFSNLHDFVSHYNDPAAQLRNYDIRSQLAPGEFYLRDMVVPNTDEVIDRIDPLANVPVDNVDQVVAFLNALTDPGSTDLASTVPESVPSGLPVLFGDPPPAERGLAHGTVSFANIAHDPESGLSDYHRVPSARDASAVYWRRRSLREPMDFPDLFETPLRSRGMPGVAIFDYDNDGDEDVFATNGPGEPNSLFVNQLVETGSLRFVDRARHAGVAARATDNNGACYGDIDNDGDEDLYVVADHGPSHLYRNEGDGTFEDVSAVSGATADREGGTSCSFGDIDGDGLLDLVVARGWNQETVYACFTDPFSAEIQPNELYRNNGDGTFADVSDTSGIRNLGGLPPFAPPGAATITWSISMVDYDADGDIDIFAADDQCGLPPAAIGGLDRGFLQIFDNDGTGHFTNRTVEAGTNQPSPWMGLSFGDFNSDGYLDFFSPSFGDWGKPFAGAPVIVGYETSRWFLGGPGKTFSNPGPGDLTRTPFGWSTTARDFDNDGDTDITFHGGLDLWFHIDLSNAGTMLLNDGDANFGLDRDAFNHARRNDGGSAAGDLDGDGFTDLVSISNFDIPEPMPIVQYGGADTDVQYFSVFDPNAYFIPVFDLDDSNDPQNKLVRQFRWNTDIVFPDGTIAVDRNSANNGNGWVQVRLIGAAGLTSGARSNRDGIGAMVYFTPEGGRTVMSPVLGGSSHLSQDSLTQGFGLGSAARGTVEILWPGGTRNRVYDVESHERLAIPEIACSYDTSATRDSYEACVDGRLAELSTAGAVDAAFAARLRASALRAYDDAH